MAYTMKRSEKKNNIVSKDQKANAVKENACANVRKRGQAGPNIVPRNMKNNVKYNVTNQLESGDGGSFPMGGPKPKRAPYGS